MFHDDCHRESTAIINCTRYDVICEWKMPHHVRECMGIRLNANQVHIIGWGVVYACEWCKHSFSWFLLHNFKYMSLRAKRYNAIRADLFLTTHTVLGRYPAMCFRIEHFARTRFSFLLYIYMLLPDYSASFPHQEKLYKTDDVIPFGVISCVLFYCYVF